MSINQISNKMHQTFLHVKNVSLVVFLFTVVILGASSQKVFAGSIVSEVKTPVTLKYDGKVIQLTTSQNTVEGAVKQSGVVLGSRDITEPSLDSKLNGSPIDIRVIRALPVLISDEKQEHLAYSAYSNADQILKQLGVVIYPEDMVETSLILDPVDENAVGQKVSIDRAPVFTVHVDGEDRIIRSWGKTVNEVLSGKVSLGQRDIIEPGLTAAATTNEISITRVNVAEVEETLPIAFDTVTQNDYSLYVGQTKVMTQGSNGEKKQTVRVTYHNGEVVDRTVLSSEVTIEPVTKVIKNGMKPYNAGAWWDALVAAGQRWGVSPTDMFNVMSCESGGNPYAGSYYKGLFQYSPSTWTGATSGYPGGAYRGASITDGSAQIYVTAWKVSQSGWSAWSCRP